MPRTTPTDPLPRLAPLLTQDARFDPAEGYLDTLPATGADSPTSLVQHVMEFPLLAQIYERWWRPAGALAFMGFNVQHFRTEKKQAVAALRLKGSAQVLDVACGPGNFTKVFAEALGPEGLAIGLDVSVPMLRRAVRFNSSPNAVYLRGDAHHLPFHDGAFDAVNCYAALYLIPQPELAFAEMLRVLRPGGRVALMTSRESRHAPVSAAQRQLLGRMGLRMFDPAEFTDALRAAGYTEVEQELHGVAQYVSATKPA